ncbi:Vacuolar protein sorting-associated protein 11-like [Durusdinium trenchii]|uniref:Vacuolar protein sorting-associated protein 11-like n=2 Tax=Durusdinium trenchii TaxID=1381693 RepID=A0ABP0NU55_9DINO
MPTPTASKEFQSEFLRLHEELQNELERLHVRLARVETHLKLDIPRDDAVEVITNLQEVPRQAALDATELKATSGAEDADDEGHVHQIHFGESAWSFPLVLGLATAGPWDVSFALLLLFLNLGMQVAFSVIIMTEDFMGSPFVKQIPFAQRWRTSIAHDKQYMDLSETSLVSRVCQGDGSLILSTTQATLIDQINSFLSLSFDEFQPTFGQTGTLLCMLCILLWALCVYKEYRSVWLALEAIWQIPRSWSTDFRHNRFYSISKGRLKLVLFTLLARVLIASLLLGAGIRWLAQTTSITELMLNAVALNAILDVDEFLFAGFTPITIQLAVQNLEPLRMKYSRRRSQAESLFLFCLLLATFLVPYFSLIQPLVESMVAVKYELCGGNQSFVVARNAETQLVLGLVTQEVQSAEVAGELSVVEAAVQSHKFRPPTEAPELIYFRSTSKLFSAFLARDMSQEVAAWAFCIETEAWQPEGTYYQDPLVTLLVETLRRNAAASLGLAPRGPSGPWTCAELKSHCDRPEARLLRMVCGVTCGCSDPYSSPWHKVPSQGCDEACSQVGIDYLATAPCEDQVDLDAWQFSWDAYADMMSAFYGSNVSTSAVFPLIQRNLATLKAVGCPALLEPSLRNEFATQQSWCQGFDKLWRPFAYICPVSCGCASAHPLPPWCPQSCWNHSR